MEFLAKKKAKQQPESLEETFTTKFEGESPAYRFTNEPFADIVRASPNVGGPVFTVTASGDPVCLFAGLGAREIYSVDVSSRANAWAEYKWQGFRALSYKEFQERFVDCDATWESFPFDLPVSEQARSLFAHKRESAGQLIRSTDIFWSQGYAAANAKSAGCFSSKKEYAKRQKAAQGAQAEFYQADFTGFFGREDVPEKYTLMYLSNVFDHITNPKTGRLDMSARMMQPLLEHLYDHLAPEGQIFINLQWSDRALGGVQKALGNLGMKLDQLRKRYNGCGRMYVAKRK